MQYSIPSYSNNIGQYSADTVNHELHYNDVIMGAIASQKTTLMIVYSTVYSGADQGKQQSSALLAFVRAIHRGPVNSPHKGPVTQNMFPFDDVIMRSQVMNKLVVDLVCFQLPCTVLEGLINLYKLFIQFRKC